MQTCWLLSIYFQFPWAQTCRQSANETAPLAKNYRIRPFLTIKAQSCNRHQNKLKTAIYSPFFSKLNCKHNPSERKQLGKQWGCKVFLGVSFTQVHCETWADRSTTPLHRGDSSILSCSSPAASSCSDSQTT